MTNVKNNPSELPGAWMGRGERVAVGTLGASMLLSGLRARGAVQLLLLAGGAGLAYLAGQGRNPAATALKIESESGEVKVREAVTVGKPVPEVYAKWADLSRLPRIMSHLKAVEMLGGNRSRWTAEAPAPLGAVSWEAETTAREENSRIAWRSLPGSQIENSGEVLFREAPGGRGTEISVRLHYRPPGGSFGAMFARALGEEPGQQLRDDLMRFKWEQEMGYSPTINGQTSGREDAGKPRPVPASQPELRAPKQGSHDHNNDISRENQA